MSADPTSLRASVVLVGYNGSRDLSACVESLLASDLPREAFELIYVDNASEDGSVGIVERHAASFPHLRVVRNVTNVGFASAVNEGADLARSAVLVVLTQDTTVDPAWLPSLLSPFADPRVAVVGSRVLAPGDAGLYAAALEVLYGGICIVHEGDRRVDAVSGCALAVRMADFRRLGGLHADLFMYGEDLDLCHRVRAAGRRVVYARDAVVRHRADRRQRASTRTYVYYMLRNRTLVCLRNYRRKRAYLLADAYALFPLTALAEWIRSRAKGPALRWVLEARVDSLRASTEILRDRRGIRGGNQGRSG